MRIIPCTSRRSFTRYLPEEYKQVVRIANVNGRDKLLIKGTVSEHIPYPTFAVVAKLGAQEEYFKNGNPEGRSRREILVEPMRSPDAFFRPEPCMKLMDEQGIHRAVMWPTLASVVQERLRRRRYPLQTPGISGFWSGPDRHRCLRLERT